MKKFVFSLLLTSCTMLPSHRGSYSTIPMMQTVTGSDFTGINVLAGRGAVWSFQTTPPSSITIKEIIHPPSLHKVYKLTLSKLKPDTTYTLTVANRKGNTIEQRFFKTFPHNKRDLRFAFGSCMNDTVTYTKTARQIWTNVQRLQPDLIVLAGDNVYVDEWHFLGKKILPQVNQIWQRYADSFQSIPFFKFKTLIPTLTTWDDHDYGRNDGDKSWGKVHNNWSPAGEAKKSFDAFFSINTSNPHHQKGPGVSSRTDFLGHRFVFLDNRTFRSPQDREYAHWGREQEKFLLQQITSSPHPLFIVNGGQFFGGYLKKESLEYNHPTHFLEFKKRINNLYQNNPTIPPFALISGDVHFSEVMRIEREQFGFETYEFTSSPWHNRLRKIHSDPKYSSLKNLRRLTAVEGSNFLFAQSSYDNRLLKVNVKAFGPNGKIPGSGLHLSVSTAQ